MPPISTELEEALSVLHQARYAPLSRWPIKLRVGTVVKPGMLGPHRVVKITRNSVFLEPEEFATKKKRFELAYDEERPAKFQVFKGGRPTLRLSPRLVRVI